ncbi:class I SAM-dependent methyltransferase [Caulobacter vibrioides]|uniref:class I SAM-dependent methyltransferase n=1 Tax=Caulobacter vibrioides TaxID=155892 RepID=UPI000BB4DAE1|nr:class I SAM-dependent methyltransferase [Caulobacter vibrioides]ATC24890.1 class I SAM-dependent methyltransferase [Caulobacter vibrioides]AZH13045.1 class I SAM-dependent methyltransferase [Caulobacter vibrioides]PLR09668.1 class I SAM-dependent methyltransferase [Caulobacter vibrioides]
MTPAGKADEDGSYDEVTLRFYANQAQAYAATARDAPSRLLARFLSQLPPGGYILELGCGDGRDSEAMSVLGFLIDPTDGVEAMAKQAEGRLKRPVRVMRFDQLDAQGAYDGVWANASLLHVPGSALPDVLSRIFRALKPGGLHMATYKAGAIEGRDSLGRYFNYPTTEALEVAYQTSAGWEILSIQDFEGGDYQGGRRPWLVVTARRPD